MKASRIVVATTLAVLASAGVARAQAHTMGWDAMTFKKPTEAELKKQLTPEQYTVTQKDATEWPFHNAFWDKIGRAHV